MITLDELIGKKAQEYRKKELEMTQEEVAKKIGVTTQTIKNFEAGRFHSAKVFSGYVDLGLKVPELIWQKGDNMSDYEYQLLDEEVARWEEELEREREEESYE